MIFWLVAESILIWGKRTIGFDSLIYWVMQVFWVRDYSGLWAYRVNQGGKLPALMELTVYVETDTGN